MPIVRHVLATLAALLAAPAPAAGRLDPVSAAGGFAIERALGCGSADTKTPQYYFWTGTVHARRAGEPDRLLFNVQGVNPRACRFVEDATRGPGYQAAARELMLYLDPATDAVLRDWRNPWTGEVVDGHPHGERSREHARAGVRARRPTAARRRRGCAGRTWARSTPRAARSRSSGTARSAARTRTSSAASIA